MEFTRLSKLSAVPIHSYQPGLTHLTRNESSFDDRSSFDPFLAYQLSHWSYISLQLFTQFFMPFSVVSHKVSLLNFFSITFLSTSHKLAQQFFIRNRLNFPISFLLKILSRAALVELDTLALPHTEWSSCEICGEVIDVNQHQRRGEHTCKQALTVLGCV